MNVCTRYGQYVESICISEAMQAVITHIKFQLPTGVLWVAVLVSTVTRYQIHSGVTAAVKIAIDHPR